MDRFERQPPAGYVPQPLEYSPADFRRDIQEYGTAANLADFDEMWRDDESAVWDLVEELNWSPEPSLDDGDL